MKKRTVLFLAMLLLTIGLYSQRDETLFSRVNFKLTGLWGGASSQVTQFGGDISQLSSLYGGFEFGKTVLIGWKGYRMDNASVMLDAQRRDLQMYYGGVMVEVMPFAWKVVHPKIGFYGGGGQVRVDRGSRDWLGVFQPSAGLELNVFRWLRVGAEAGYRFANPDGSADVRSRDISTAYGEVSIKLGGSWGRR